MRIIGNVLAIILIFFGVLFVWGAFSPSGQIGWIIVGIITIAIGCILLLIINRRKESKANNQNITLKVDLPASTKLENMQCRSCGGALTMDNIHLAAGDLIVNCPYCHTTYQLSEDPKW